MSEIKILQGPELSSLGLLLEKYRRGQNKFGDMIIGPFWVNLIVEKITGGDEKALALTKDGQVEAFVIHKTGSNSVLASMVYVDKTERREALLSELVFRMRKIYSAKSIVFGDPVPDMDIEAQKRIFLSAGFRVLERYKMEFSAPYEVKEVDRPPGFTFKKYSKTLDRKVARLDQRAYRDHPDEPILEVLTDTGSNPPSLRIVRSGPAFFERSLSSFALSGSELAGGIYCTHMGKELWISNLVVDPHFRGQGLGKYLLFKVLKGMKPGGYRRCMLMVSADNHSALNMYKKFRFKLKRNRFNFVYTTGQGVKNH
ncbi:MAG TPA: GNAT family N-acetyltransferase [candidate division Zixibacteria bacterium]|nr:GNAT family N-acetyltransferase [candidate division Zixibacteria bacterium]HER00539.1 GNAT family N-acetyltransferase [candidate division Zixibacteria bacterium]